MWTCPNCSMPNDDDVPICRSCETSRRPTAQPGDPAYPAPADPWAPQVEEIIPIPAPPTEPGFAPSESGFAPSESAPARTAATQPTPFGTTPLETTPQGPGPVGPVPVEPIPVEPIPVEPIPLEPVPLEPAPLEPAPGDGGPRPTRWILPVALVFVVVVGVAAAVVVPRLLAGRDDRAGGGSPTAAPVTTIGTPEPSTAGPTDTVTGQPTTTAPTTAAGGIVVVGPSVTDDRAARVAAMFDTYFSGINSKDYDSVGSVLDPAGAVNPHSASDMAELAEGTRSTTDSNVVLTSLSGTSGGLLSAEVTFQSKQNAGDGPRGRPGETCTRWDIRYTVSSAYRIRKSKATSQPC